MPVHQLNGLAGQCPLDVGDKFVKVQDMLGAGFAEINTTLLTRAQIIQEALTSQPDQFPGHNLTRNDPFGIANAI
ncbi:hypothetical protein Xkoz_03848 [Xenorhabdus kozodoii]|uniref:Uncharacterized protein n=1 Tax=Xenorhabdus kozodoii TaxID=351676 RepID=A0A2D0KQG1_9GAMM|nr:hypothetical protein Xkoz_03848 [Xenorhabdus kozodoii]